jgi:hypothetical protein
MCSWNTLGCGWKRMYELRSGILLVGELVSVHGVSVGNIFWGEGVALYCVSGGAVSPVEQLDVSSVPH